MNNLVHTIYIWFLLKLWTNLGFYDRSKMLATGCMFYNVRKYIFVSLHHTYQQRHTQIPYISIITKTNGSCMANGIYDMKQTWVSTLLNSDQPRGIFYCLFDIHVDIIPRIFIIPSIFVFYFARGRLSPPIDQIPIPTLVVASLIMKHVWIQKM